MYSMLISIAAGLIAAAAAYFGHLSVFWTIMIGLTAFLAVFILISQIIRIKVKRIQNHIQEVMMEVQHKLQMKQNQFMRRPLGSPKAMMQVLEKDQAAGTRQTLEVCSEFAPFYRWSFLLERQINTMKMAFYYQLKDYEKVDKLLPKCLILDAQSMSLKMARMYQCKDQNIDKFYQKKCSRLKEPACILPTALYSWILVKQERYDDALKVLVEAKKRTDNETIMHNWEALVNKKYKSFSNAGLAETWYALGLEEPKMPKTQQIRYR